MFVGLLSFLATLVALHFTPVSKSLGHSFGLAKLRGLRACLLPPTEIYDLKIFEEKRRNIGAVLEKSYCVIV